MSTRISQAGQEFYLATCLCVCLASNPTAVSAGEAVDLTGTYKGLFLDRGRNIRRTNFRLRITHDGDRVSAEATDRTLWITGLVVESKVFVDWEHASGEHGEGIWDILEDGNRLRGTWKSSGSGGRYYGEWDVSRQ